MNSPLPPGKVRCISLWQPWASLMACGAKTLETRSWGTGITGEVYIHASVTKKGLVDLNESFMDSVEGMDRVAAMEKALGIPFSRWRAELPFGAIVGKGHLIQSGDAEKALACWPDQLHFGDFSPGRFAHAYMSLEKVGPLSLTGKQGFFFATLPSSPSA